MDPTSHSSSPNPTFSFPILKPNEILDCMLELGLEMSKTELSEPSRHKEKLRKVFLLLLQECAGKREEDLQMDPADNEEAAGNCSDYPELHSVENFSELVFFKALCDLMTTCGYKYFSWRDLYAPEPKRLRHQLSAILNFVKFREEQISVYHELNGPRAQMVQSLDELNQEHIELEKQLLVTEEEYKFQTKVLEEIDLECQELELEIARNNRLQATSREEATALKKKANDLQDELATVTWALQETEAEEESLRAAVVSSPDRRKAEVEHRRQRLNHITEECATVERQLQDSKTKIVTVVQLRQEFESITSTLKDLQKQAAQYKELTQRLELTRAEIAVHDKKSAEINEAIEQAEREHQRAEKAIVHQREQQVLHVAAVQEALEDAKSQLLAAEKDRRDGMARVEAGEKEVRELEATMEEERHQTQVEMEAMIAEYKETEQLFLERHNKRMELIDT